MFFLFILFIGFLFFVARKKPSEEQLKEIEKIQFPENFGWALAVSVLALNLFSYETSHGIGTGLFNLFFVAAIFLTFPPAKRTPVVIGVSLLSIFASFGVGYTSNGFVQSVDGFVMTMSNIFLLLLHSLEKVQWSGLWLIRQVFASIGRGFRQVGLLFRQTQHPDLRKKSRVLLFIKTAIISSVIIVFFLMLLSSADPVFSELIKDVRDQAVGRVIASIIFAVLLSVILSVTVSKKESDEAETKLSFLSFQDLFVSLSGVVILFAVFLGVQSRYLFASHNEFLSFGLTYSEYVRKGFTELLFASFFGISLAYLVIMKKNVVSDEGQQKKLSWLNAIFLIELFLLLGSALKRDMMYMDEYGLTRVRMIGGVFLAWLAGFLILVFLLSVWKKMQERYLLSGLLALSVGVVAFLNLVNIDAIVVRSTPSHHKFKDYFYINSLSEDALDGWAESVPAAEATFNKFKAEVSLDAVEKAELANAKLAMIALTEKREKLEKKYGPEKMVIDKYFDYLKDASLPGDPSRNRLEIPSYFKPERAWQSYNWREYMGYKKIVEDPSLVSSADALLRDIRAFQHANQIELYDQEWRLLHELRYTFVDVNLRYYPERIIKNNPTYPPVRVPSP